MTIVADQHSPNSARPHFRTPPWHDTHPAKRDIEQRLDADHLARTCVRTVDRRKETAEQPDQVGHRKPRSVADLKAGRPPSRQGSKKSRLIPHKVPQ
jgi:hypothetical protein